MATAKSIPSWWMPAAWPILWRRIFIATILISGPVWLAAVAVCGVIAAVGVLIIAVFFVLPFMIANLILKLWASQPGERR